MTTSASVKVVFGLVDYAERNRAPMLIRYGKRRTTPNPSVTPIFWPLRAARGWSRSSPLPFGVIAFRCGELGAGRVSLGTRNRRGPFKIVMAQFPFSRKHIENFQRQSGHFSRNDITHTSTLDDASRIDAQCGPVLAHDDEKIAKMIAMQCWPLAKSTHLMGLAGILLGLLGCGKSTPAPPIALREPALRRCNLARIWIHALEDTGGMSASNFDACNSACEYKNSTSCIAAGLLLLEGRAVSKDETKARLLFERQCKANEPMGCIALWMSTLDTHTAMRSDPLSEELLLASTCGEGEIQACDVLGWFYRDRVERLRREEDNELAVKYSLAACNGGSRLGCTGVAWLQAYGFGIPKDRKKAADTFQKQCLTGYSPACDYLGNLYYSGDIEEQDLAKAADLYRSACRVGVLRSCAALGSMLSDDDVPAREGETAFGLYEKACKAGGAGACYGVGLSYQDGKGVAQNLAYAFHYFDLACEAGSASACYDLAWMYYHGEDDVVAENDAEAAVLFEKSCWLGDPNGCYHLGSSYADGIVLPKNTARSAEYFELACNEGRADGCYKIGISYFTGVGVAQNQKKGATFLQKACDRHCLDACVRLGELYRVGTGVPQDEGRAVELAKKACNNNDMQGCVLLGSLYEHGSDAIKDAAQSVALFQKACDFNVDAACVNLGNAYVAGHGIKQDIAKARALFMNSCNHGSALGCFGLAGTYVKSNAAKALKLLDNACPTIPEACDKAKELRSKTTP